MSNLAPPTPTRATCPLQTLQRTCIWQLFMACPALEDITVEVDHRSVLGWAAKLVDQIRDLQFTHSLALRLQSLELISRAEVQLYSLWCAVLTASICSTSSMSQAPRIRRATASVSVYAVDCLESNIRRCLCDTSLPRWSCPHYVCHSPRDPPCQRQLVQSRMCRFGCAPSISAFFPPLHVTLRAPVISFPADSIACMANKACWTVERLTLCARSIRLNHWAG